jgi:hypothetical protein
MHAPSLLLTSGTLFAAIVWVFAFWRGGAAERWGAGVAAANQIVAILIMFAASGGARQYLGLLVQLSLDGAAAVALLFVLLRYGRPWLGVAMLLYAVQFTLQSAYLVLEIKKNVLYVVVNDANFIAIHVALAVGTAQHWLRTRRPHLAAS